jgi:hypothetical protein
MDENREIGTLLMGENRYINIYIRRKRSLYTTLDLMRHACVRKGKIWDRKDIPIKDTGELLEPEPADKQQL